MIREKLSEKRKGCQKGATEGQVMEAKLKQICTWTRTSSRAFCLFVCLKFFLKTNCQLNLVSFSYSGSSDWSGMRAIDT